MIILGIHRILIIKLRSIGDVIMATPVIENLRAAYPDAQIDFLTESPCYPIVKNHPALNEVIVFNRSHISSLWWFAALRENLKFLKRLRAAKYDLVLDLFGNPRSALFTLATGAPIRAGFAFRGRKYAYNKIFEPRGDQIHEVLFNLDALTGLGLPVRTTRLFYEIDDLSAAFAESFWQENQLDNQTVVGINASGGWYTKRWPLASFASLADRLASRKQVKILLFWGPGEKRDAEEIAAKMQHEALLIPATDLGKLAALLAKIDLLVSNDSGPMHLAAAVNTPVVGIYGPTVPELQGPWGEQHLIVQKEGLACLGCNGVICKIETHDCMQKLEVEAVLKKAEQLLQNISTGHALYR